MQGQVSLAFRLTVMPSGLAAKICQNAPFRSGLAVKRGHLHFLCRLPARDRHGQQTTFFMRGRR